MILFQVHYLSAVQGGKHVVGRDYAYVASAPEARRAYLCHARRLLREVIRVRARASPTLSHSDCLALNGRQALRRPSQEGATQGAARQQLRLLAQTSCWMQKGGRGAPRSKHIQAMRLLEFHRASFFQILKHLPVVQSEESIHVVWFVNVAWIGRGRFGWRDGWGQRPHWWGRGVTFAVGLQAWKSRHPFWLRIAEGLPAILERVKRCVSVRVSPCGSATKGRLSACRISQTSMLCCRP
jgi:hypothetical protein